MTKKYLRTVGGLLTISAFLLINVIAKPNKDDIIARVTDVQGKTLQVQRSGAGNWEKGSKNTPGFIRDHFRTDAQTTAALELLVGARVGIKKNSEIALLSDKEAGTIDGKKVRKIALSSGGIYAKFHKQEQPITIQTRGGVMGIKGTEFNIDTQDDGQTEVTLLEGSVDYTYDKKPSSAPSEATENSEPDDQNETVELVPGQKLSQFEKDGELYVVKGEPDQVDSAVADFIRGNVPIANIHSVQDALNTNWANLGPDTVNNIINSGRNSILQELPGPIGSVVNNFLPSSVINWSGASWSYPGLSLPSGFSFP